MARARTDIFGVKSDEGNVDRSYLLSDIMHGNESGYCTVINLYVLIASFSRLKYLNGKRSFKFFPELIFFSPLYPGKA
jgi:hypothetical protein